MGEFFKPSQEDVESTKTWGQIDTFIMDDRDKPNDKGEVVITHSLPATPEQNRVITELRSGEKWVIVGATTADRDPGNKLYKITIAPHKK